MPTSIDAFKRYLKALTPSRSSEMLTTTDSDNISLAKNSIQRDRLKKTINK